ncbi:MAG TPA: S8 family peptidase [Pyrinomonadaceae bacterium]|nr:S8 family peptidase [Pyrinomonadaceae bacterium]
MTRSRISEFQNLLAGNFRRFEQKAKHRLIGLLSILAMLSLTLAPAGLTAGEFGMSLNLSNTDPGRYIVQLSDAPLASYRGGILGLAPTNPAVLGQVKLDATSGASRAYLDYLAQRQSSFLVNAQLTLGRPVAVLANYRYAFNGVALAMTAGEAAKVSRMSVVKQVQPERIYQLHTDVGPAWIGAPSLWNGSATGGAAGTKGEGVVVGVIDTGVNHDHRSFADVGGDGYNHTNPRGSFFGVCDPVTGLPFCNDKLIGVWDFTGTTPEDDNLHGSHTASTAAGNVVTANIQAPTMTLTREVSGVAPHANLITYKACDTASGGCRGISLGLAIDQATADGVDVINFSIGGGSSDPWADANALGFLGARDAGIFVAASAGNDGPGASTVGSPSNAPWLMSVAASTHNRKFVSSVVNMSGGATAAPANIAGASVSAGHGPARIVYAGDYGYPLCGDGPADAATGKAAINPFTPGTFNGEIVICDRGTYGRVEKGENVKEGGAGGMILANDAANGGSLIGDAHALPAVHISYAAGNVLKNWVANGEGHTGTITPTVSDVNAANGDAMASFSSRGPDKSSPGILKPDVTAPGVDILAAFNTLGNTGQVGGAEWGVISGTSMSSPHSAGAAALVRAVHPNWTPAEVQSALMTTSVTSGVNVGGKIATPFDRGAGRVDLTQAARAGLVLKETLSQGQTVTQYYEAGQATPTSLNRPSMANADCKGTCSWTRVVTSTLNSTATWSAKTTAPKGVRLNVSPSKFTIAPGGTQAITITADVADAPVGQWSFAELSLTSKGVPTAHLPIAVFPGGTAQPVNIATTSTTGSHTQTVTSDLEIGRFSSVISGLSKGHVIQRQMEQDPTSGGIPGSGTGLIGILTPYEAVAGTFFITMDVPQGARFLMSEITASTAPDVDLFVGRDLDGDNAPDAAEEVCRSASGVWQEKCTLKAPAAGKWWILVQNWASSPALIDTIELTAAVIPGTNNGNLTATGPSTTIPAGQPFDILLTWNEPALAAGDYWFALVEYGADSRHPNNAGSLLVRINRTQ